MTKDFKKLNKYDEQLRNMPLDEAIKVDPKRTSELIVKIRKQREQREKEEATRNCPDRIKIRARLVNIAAKNQAEESARPIGSEVVNKASDDPYAPSWDDLYNENFAMSAKITYLESVIERVRDLTPGTVSEAEKWVMSEDNR